MANETKVVSCAPHELEDTLAEYNGSPWRLVGLVNTRGVRGNGDVFKVVKLVFARDAEEVSRGR